ncbi:hypothetical protein [Pseudomonas aeruginosa]|uniref:hypothetical protein n=1 Tax=Pseudomonas aeruginosa TaxID=287 RepID=UPI000937916A|nr:hypothetical protein [Pseudomonas aeruginosa]MEE2520598.1 hypothetical protein [Pseudomonas aeruginosa]
MKAEDVRAKADADEVSKYLANIVPASEIGARKNGFDFLAGYSRIPSEPKKYRAWLEKRLESELIELERDKARYEEVRLGGLDALTDGDLLYEAGTATERAKAAFETIFYLKSAHISARHSSIQGIRKELEKLQDGQQQGQQSEAVEVPPGFELVDVILPARQAFIVKKWAEAAEAKIKAARKKR